MRKVVLVSLDALFIRDMEMIPPEGFLARMMREGTFCRQVETVFPALTYPIHVTMVTGCEPDRTGVGQNQPLQSGVAKNERVWYWERKYIQVPTLFDAVKAAGGKNCSILWPVGCKNPAVKWLFPEVHPLKGENPALKALRYGSPGYILRGEKRYGHLRKGIAEPWLSDYATALGMDTIRRRRPDFTALHLIDLDGARHQHGTFSPEAREALNRDDRRLAEIRKTMDATPGMEDALLIAVSDHGQEDIRETVNLTKKIREMRLEKEILVQSNGMSACFFPGPAGCPDPENIRRLVDERKDEMGIAKTYSREEMDRMHAVKGPVFAAEAAEGVVFSDGLDEEKREAATHGFGPGREADLCLFAVIGNGIRKGYEIPEMKMRDVGPTIAGLMGLRLEGADGRDLSGAFLL